jgi:hypothetical protein
MNVALLMLTNNGFSHVHLLLPARNCAICNISYNSPEFVIDMEAAKTITTNKIPNIPSLLISYLLLH